LYTLQLHATCGTAHGVLARARGGDDDVDDDNDNDDDDDDDDDDDKLVGPTNAD